MTQTKIHLDERDMPKQWYNIQADLPKPLPPAAAPGDEAAHRPRRPGARSSRWG